MSEALMPLITTQGLASVSKANQASLGPVCITHAALGEAGYAMAVDDAGQATATALQKECERVPLLDGQAGQSTQLSLSFMADGPQSYWVNELGFFLDDGTLFALWSHPERSLAFKSDQTPLMLALELVLTSLPAGSVTVAGSGANLQLLMTKEIAIFGTAIADLQHQQLLIQDQLRVLRDLP